MAFKAIKFGRLLNYIYKTETAMVMVWYMSNNATTLYLIMIVQLQRRTNAPRPLIAEKRTIDVNETSIDALLPSSVGDR